MITNPARLAKIFNEFFINKVRKLRAKARKVPNSDPVLRVRKWLEKTPSSPPIFRIKKIDTEALRRALKRIKGKKVHGVDNIDLYSLKIAGPLMKIAGPLMERGPATTSEQIHRAEEVCKELETTVGETTTQKEEEKLWLKILHQCLI